jgi:CRP-like cAMP-binding protein
MKTFNNEAHSKLFRTEGVLEEGSAALPLTVTPARPLFPCHVPFTGLFTNQLLTALPGEEFAGLLPHLEPVSFSAGQEIYRFGESIQVVYFPETAVLSHIFLSEDGSSTGATLIGNDGLVGLSGILDSKPAPYWTHVLIGGTAIKTSRSFLCEVFNRSPAFRNLLLSYTRVRLSQLSQRVVCNCRHTLAQRLCTWLLSVGDRSHAADMPLTHEQISSHLGARRAGVTNVCNALRDASIISYRRGNIRILDRERLEAAACECYRAVSKSTVIAM